MKISLIVVGWTKLNFHRWNLPFVKMSHGRPHRACTANNAFILCETIPSDVFKVSLLFGQISSLSFKAQLGGAQGRRQREGFKLPPQHFFLKKNLMI